MSADLMDASQLQSRFIQLEEDHARLRRFAERVFDMTMGAQPGTALHICQSLNTQARQALVCSPDCTASHPVRFIAWREGVSRQTVYNWLESAGVEIENGCIPHDVARRCRP
jgi:hypothetical protein